MFNSRGVGPGIPRGGFAILHYFHAKFPVQGPNAVKYPFPGSECMIFMMLKSLEKLTMHIYLPYNKLFHPQLHEILYNTEGALPVHIISTKANTAQEVPTLAHLLPNPTNLC